MNFDELFNTSSDQIRIYQVITSKMHGKTSYLWTIT